MAQIGFTDKQAHVYARFQQMRRDYENAHGRTYAPDFLTVLMDAWELIEGKAHTIRRSGLSAKIGDRVKCKYGNLVNKFWCEFLDTNPVIEKIRFNKMAGMCEFKLSGNETWWYENDFEIFAPVNETK